MTAPRSLPASETASYDGCIVLILGWTRLRGFFRNCLTPNHHPCTVVPLGKSGSYKLFDEYRSLSNSGHRRFLPI